MRMRWWSEVRKYLTAMPSRKFDSTPRPIDQVILEFAGRGAARVTRTEALSVPAVQRGRNMICSVATLPLVQHDRARNVVDNQLFEQLDPDVANVVTLTQTVEDLLFEGTSWWQITAFGWDGYPTSVRHLDHGTVSLLPPSDRSLAPLPSGLDPREAVVYVDGQVTAASEMIRFDSPNPAVLVHGARAIRRAILLDKAAGMYADDPRPLDYFTPAEGADPVEDTEVEQILSEWKSARKKRTTAYVPQALKYNTVDAPSPADLQLVELQRQAVLDIANALGVEPEDLGLSTTSRTYANAVDRRRDRINDVLSPFMRAITDRLSMGDVTKRGHKVVFDLDDYMRANPTERWNVYKIAKDMGVMDVDEIRAEENLPAKNIRPSIPAPAPAPAALPVDASAWAGMTFDDVTGLTFADVPLTTFAVDAEARTITGLALPYGKVGSKGGLKFRFVKGSLQWGDASRVKLLRDHDFHQPIGYATKLADTAAGLQVTFKIARGEAGDNALALAEDKVLDGMSVGVDFDFAVDTVPDPKDKSVALVRRADLREVSLTAMPAFDDARVSTVAASLTEGDLTVEPCMTCGQVHAVGVACTTPPPPVTPAPAPVILSADPPVVPAPAPAPSGLALTADQLTALAAVPGGLAAIFGAGATPAPAPTPEGRTVVNPTRATAVTLVAEEMPYRFDRRGNLTKGVQYDFSTDLVAGFNGDGEAKSRAEQFMRAAFDVDKADAASLNPNRQRPDMYVDQREFNYPIWDAISRGTIADATPFVLPKFSSASGLVAAHTEAVEPTPGTFVATSQTITPTPVSGKVEITREAWDQGGNPQLSGIIWRQMTRAWFEALEASAVTLLDGLTPTGITLTTAAVDAALTGELEAALAALQFVRGGFRMRDFFIQVDLYKNLIDATDADGRKLLPLLGASNANGSTSEFFADVMVGGLRGRPAWALAASGSVAASSYLFDRNDVHGWASAPQRMEFQHEVRYINLAIWGYKATANTDLTGVREIIYDPTV